MSKLSIELNRYLFEEEREQKVSLRSILALAGERGFGFLFVILSLPSALPVPAPGYSIPFGIVLLILAMQFIVGAKRPLLPGDLGDWSVKTELAQKFATRGIPWLKRLEQIAKPRFVFICQNLPGRAVIGGAIALMSISMMIPIPGTNTLPAMGIFLIGIGLFEDDGMICVAGATLCGAIAATMASVIWVFYKGGTSILDIIKNWVKGLL
ncbi:MAG: exopolysaccharide biosynthesis protein [Cyanobacteria bacterium P01_G01_bin.54]